MSGTILANGSEKHIGYRYPDPSLLIPQETANDGKDAPLRLRGLIEDPLFRNAPGKTTVALGKDADGNSVYADIADMPHLLVAGAVGTGKSVCIHTLLTSVFYKARPDEVRLILIDPKCVEFTIYENIPHLLVPIIYNTKQALGALRWAEDEMNRRFRLMAAAEARDINSYAKIRDGNPSLEPLPRLLIVVDEWHDLVPSLKNPEVLDNIVTRIAQKARAAGIHLILGTQWPTPGIITGSLKANIPTRIAFRTASRYDSRTILNTTGAEELLQKGDMLFQNAMGLQRIRGCYVSIEEIYNVTEFLRDGNNENVTYDENAMAGIDSAKKSVAREDKEFVAPTASERMDTLFWDAVEIALQHNKATLNLLARQLGKGYTLAGKILDRMQEYGIVAEPNEKNVYELLMNPDEVEALRHRLKSGDGNDA